MTTMRRCALLVVACAVLLAALALCHLALSFSANTDPAPYTRLGLEGPVQVVDANSYLDGGSITLDLLDRTGRKQRYVLDGSSTDDRHNHLYRGPDFPRGPDLEKFPWGGQEEADLARILETWVATNVPVHRRTSLWSYVEQDFDAVDPAPEVLRVCDALQERTDESPRAGPHDRGD